MLVVVEVLALAAAFFLPWLIGAMRNSVKNKNKKALMLAALLCSIDVFILAVSIALAFALNKK